MRTSLLAVCYGAAGSSSTNRALFGMFCSINGSPFPAALVGFDFAIRLHLLTAMADAFLVAITCRDISLRYTDRIGSRMALMAHIYTEAALSYADYTIRGLRKKSGYEDDLSLMMIVKDQAGQTVLSLPFFPGC
jgi:hypothetical protein